MIKTWNTDPMEGGDVVVRLHLRRTATVDLDRVPLLLGADLAPWLGERVGGVDGRRDFSCDFEMLVRPESRAIFRKAAIVSLGQPRVSTDGWTVACEWRAAGLAPLFPVFAGHLHFEADAVTLTGWYAPPLGVIGYALDRALLGIAARGTARWFLGRLAATLGQSLSAPDPAP